MSEHSAPPRIAIALVNYRTEVMTRTCLELLREALTGYDAEVWVVDNDSADGSTEYLRSLDWIRLIERKAEGREPGFHAHGRALNLAQERTTCDYLFLLHTDTLIHDGRIFRAMLDQCLADDKVFLVGCLEQIYRGPLRTAWRIGTRFISHHLRRAKLALGLKSRPPKPYRETHVKSFCALWNLRLMRENRVSFLMSHRNPGYEAQDVLLAAGFKRNVFSPREIFHYLDHIKAGTTSVSDGSRARKCRSRKYQGLVGGAAEQALQSA
ncbi:glycosyltransferase family 2 protein [Propionivibrio limicola]|uniref:glycosyltransferase family 2 protein n=1 Tax=Propionivibrio limicola TaxID=167645 RepID=UPI00129097CD|nr:glycosyltransferase family 2 protein [Propionivibrio limicola]